MINAVLILDCMFVESCRETQLSVFGDVMKICFAAGRGGAGGTAVIT